jgi:TRAP transporter TAXI family solute receptor
MALNAFRIAIVLTALSLFRPAAAGEAHWPDLLTIGTASRGGVYFDYGEAVAKILTRELGMPVVARPTGGPRENIALLESGEIQLAFVTLGVAQQAWNGQADWTGGKQMRAMRAVFPMYDTPFQFMARDDAGIQSLADLNGKRVGIGPEGGTSETYMPAIFKRLKIEPTLATGEWADLAKQVEDKTLDALAVAAGVPFPSFTEIERKTKVRYLPLAANQIVDLRLAMPELGASSVTAGIYPSLRRTYQTVGLYNFAVARADLPLDLVYAITDAIFANQEELAEASPAAAATVPSNFTRNSFLPFHAGASRWYQNNSTLGVLRGD